jgi:metallo-beta-lactamase family protein
MHVRNNIGNDRNRILIAGFCAEGTLGWRLLQGQDFVEINHKQRPVRASIRRTDVFSAHPDHEQMVAYFEKTHSSRGLKGLFLVHGDFVQMQKLAGDIGFCPVHLPSKGEEFQLN